jgi:hypothetical protein
MNATCLKSRLAQQALPTTYLRHGVSALFKFIDAGAGDMRMLPVRQQDRGKLVWAAFQNNSRKDGGAEAHAPSRSTLFEVGGVCVPLPKKESRLLKSRELARGRRAAGLREKGATGNIPRGRQAIWTRKSNVAAAFLQLASMIPES